MFIVALMISAMVRMVVVLVWSVSGGGLGVVVIFCGCWRVFSGVNWVIVGSWWGLCWLLNTLVGC